MTSDSTLKRMTGRRRSTRLRARHGFTIIEVLVALGLTGVVAIGLYTLSAVASQTFQQQQRVSEMQLRLRSAMEILRADIQRAGYQATPNSVFDPSICPRRDPQLFAVALSVDNPNPTHLAADNRFINPVRMMLVGNFASTDEYKIGGVNGTRVLIQHRWDEWRRVTSAQDMARIFPIGGLVRLRSLDGSIQFGTVSGINYRDSLQPITLMPSVDLTIPVTINDGLTTGCGLNSSIGWIAPVSVIDYRIANVGATQTNAYAGSPQFSLGKTDLVRRRYTIAGGALTPDPVSETIVSEYAVDFAIGAVMDNGGGLPEPVFTRYAPGDPALNLLLPMPNVGASFAHRLRSLTFRLSVRDRAQDPDFGWIQRAGANQPLSRFRVNAAMPGAARVRTATSEITLINIASRGLR
jgi:prepilin-type N-terminal cleavage/methylation domain-containing protein